MIKDSLTIAVVGLGYVGLPLAVAFAKAGQRVVGFDINEKRISSLKRARDESGEVDEIDLKNAEIKYSSNPKDLKQANFIIVAVPTPVNKANQPDLGLIESASRLVGQNLAKGATIVYESTVYPGVTEDVCVPIIERESQLKAGQGFFIGYSPERVNPGDKEHTIDKIIKIVSGMDKKTLNHIAEVYSIVCAAGVHKAPNIKTAEAAKVFENIQRDVNIALVNELSLICHRLGIKTTDVLDAGGTKWNFLKFRPGLVGGHCVGVDPYYLVQKAEELGIHPQVISAGRRVNDFMAEFVAQETISGLIEAGKPVKNAKVLVMGLTFKENIKDVRNSKISVTIEKLKGLGVKISGLDPNLTVQEIKEEFQIEKVQNIGKGYDAVLVSANHKEFKNSLAKILISSTNPPVIIDVNGLYSKELNSNQKVIYKTL